MDATDLAFSGAARAGAAHRRRRGLRARGRRRARCARIERLDPALNAFRVVLAERALAEAQQADARRRAGDARPLLGVPVAIKDDTDVAGVPTARGTAASDLTPRDRDAEVVRRLRAAGAIVVGKTNVPELMMWPFTESVSFGAARNPWALDRTPGGSSGGSGAAVAAGLCGVALGTDGAGSIRIPAAFCGVFGLKPQRGRVPVDPGDERRLARARRGGPLARTRRRRGAVPRRGRRRRARGGFAAAAAREPGRLRIAVSTNMPPGIVARLGARAARRRRGDRRAAALARPRGRRARRRLRRVRRRERARALPARHPRRGRARCRTPSGSSARTRAMMPPRRPRPAGGARAGARAPRPALAARIGAVFATADVLLTARSARAAVPGRRSSRAAARCDAQRARAAKVPVLRRLQRDRPPGVLGPGRLRRRRAAARRPARRPPATTRRRCSSLAAQIEQARPWADRRPPL